MTDQDLIAAFLAKKTVTTVTPAYAYGANPKADAMAKNSAKVAKQAKALAAKQEAKRIVKQKAVVLIDNVELGEIGEEEMFYLSMENSPKNSSKPIRNWKLQAEYDDKHGTINGCSPWLTNHER